MPEDLEQQAKALRDEAHALTAATKARARIFAALLILNIVALGILAGGVLQARTAADNARAASAAAAVATKGNLAVLNFLRGVTDPKGCTAVRNNYQTALAIWSLENDNRRIHDVALLPPPPKPSNCKVPTLPTPTKTVTQTVIRVVPGPTVTVVRCVRPSGHPC